MAEDEVQVNISATDNTQGGLDSAKENVDGLESHVEAGFERISQRLLEYFALDKISSFIKEGISGFAAVGRAYDLLGAQIKASGGNWSTAKGQVEDFVQAEEDMYGTTKEKVIEALQNAELGVNNLGAALKITDEAEKLSTLNHHSLQQAVEMISRAYAGNTRGLRQLGNELKMNNTDSADAVKVFKKLEQSTNAVTGALSDQQGQLNRVSAEWEDTQQQVGGALSSLLPGFEALEKVAATLIESIFNVASVLEDGFAGPIMVVISAVHRLYQVLEGVTEFMMGHFRLGIHDAGQAMKNLAIDVQEAGSQIVDDMHKWGNDTVGIWKQRSHELKLINDATFLQMAADNAKHAALEKADLVKHKAAKKKELKEKKKQKQIEDDEDFQSSRSLQEHLVQLVATGSTDVLQIKKKTRDEARAGEITSAQSLNDELMSIAQSSNKKTMELAKTFSIGRAVINTAQGVTEAFADYPYPGSLIVAAQVAAAGAIQIASIEGVALADGGIATRSTFANIGEGGEPEAVVPLSKAAEYGFGGGGGDTHNHTWNFPGVQNRDEARAAGQSAGLAFIKSQYAAKQRSGNRNTKF